MIPKVIAQVEPNPARQANGWRPPAEGSTGLPPGLLPAVRQAQEQWAASALPHRLRLVARFRRGLVAAAETLARASSAVRGIADAEVYSSEVLPLADACRFLETEAARILATRSLGRRGRPLWLWGASSEVVREPCGVVLILAPSNYPLFLPGVQMIQALVAGNAVLVKPAPGCDEPLRILGQLLANAGLPPHLCSVLPVEHELVAGWIRQAADLVILTGGAAAGRAVMKACAESLVPCIMELSGLDSLHVLADADLERVVSALLFGTRLNRGKTCIAPRRLLVQSEAAARLRQLLGKQVPGPSLTLPEPAAAEVRKALQSGAVIRCGAWRDADGSIAVPLVLEGVPQHSPLWTTDHFAPVAVMAEMAGIETAIQCDRQCPFALGASIFSRDLKTARDVARRLPAGVITINDTVAPTADPRLPFGGSQQSGFGVTRGEEGLLALTRPKVIIRRHAQSWTPHLEPGTPDRDRGLLLALHGRDWRSRWDGWRLLIKARRKSQQAPGKEGP